MASLWQEAFDEASQCTYYYHIETGETSWTLPLDEDAPPEDLSFLTFAVVRLQSHFRGDRDRHRVKRLVQTRYQTTVDPTTGEIFYANRRTGTSSWTPPALVTRLGIEWNDEDKDDDDDDDFDVDVFQQHLEEDKENVANNDDQSDNEEEEINATKKKRAFPRSAAQQRVDAAEDIDDGATTLDLSGLNAWKLSSRIWNIATLTTLSLSQNQLTRIPSGIQDLVHLKHLDVSHNHLTRLPSCLQTTSTLTILDASHNRITTFSPKLWKLRGLVELRLGHNCLADIPYVEGDLKLLRDTREWSVGVGLLTVLQVLDLSHNHLTVLPQSIEKCVALRVLDLQHNRLGDLAEQVGDLESLVELRLSNNSLHQLPESIGALVNLTTLLVEANRLSTLPESIGNLQNLVDLDLRLNHIHRLGDAFGTLGQLRNVHLDDNPSLANLSTCWRFLPSIESFSAAQCGLVAFESTDFLAQAPVTHLCLCNNALREFPVNLVRSAMQHTLRELILSHNTLQSFPMEIVVAPCRALVTLDLSHNNLRVIPNEIASLRSLQMLVLSHNALGPTLPDAIAWLPHLHTLRCDHNRLTSLPLSIGILKTLQHIDVGFNEIEVLPTSFLDVVDSLRSLHVNDNCLLSPPPVIALLSPSCFVDLSNNPFCTDAHATQTLVPQVYAAAVKCFDDQEYDTAEELLTQSLTVLEGMTEGIGGWKLRHIHLPNHLCLRGLCRYMVMKRARLVISETSETIEACEIQLHGDYLIRQRAASRNHKVTECAPTKRPDVRDERPETEDSTVDVVVKALPFSTSNQQEDNNPTQELLETAQQKRTIARNRASMATTGALADLTRALDLHVAERATAYVVLGFLYMETLEFARAIESFTDALDCVVPSKDQPISLTSIPIFMARAEAFRLLGQLPSALDDVDRIISTRPPDAPDDVVDKAKALARKWETQQSQYFVDHDSLLRAFDVVSSSGLPRRPEVHDLHAILSATQRHDRHNKTPTQRFEDSVASLVKKHGQRNAAVREAMQTTYEQKAHVLAHARDFRREIRENLVMEMEELTQRQVEAELARLAELRRQERDCEFNERMFMQYEDEYMRWFVSEEARLEAERLRREEDARRKAEAKAQYEMRVARRGGRRQQLASRGARASSPAKKAGR